MPKQTGSPIILLIGFILSGILLSACQPVGPELEIDIQTTAFTHTAQVQASLTRTAQPTPIKTLVPSPTDTPTETPTSAPTLTPTPTEPADQPPTGSTDSAIWLANDPPDYTKFSPGESFTVTWTIENIGTSTWSTSYYIAFVSGERMEAVEKVMLPYLVPPEKHVQLSVDFVAPATPGIKQTNWKLFNAEAVAFYNFFILIEVVEGGD